MEINDLPKRLGIGRLIYVDIRHPEELLEADPRADAGHVGRSQIRRIGKDRRKKHLFVPGDAGRVIASGEVVAEPVQPSTSTRRSVSLILGTNS